MEFSEKDVLGATLAETKRTRFFLSNSKFNYANHPYSYGWFFN